MEYNEVVQNDGHYHNIKADVFMGVAGSVSEFVTLPNFDTDFCAPFNTTSAATKCTINISSKREYNDSSNNSSNISSNNNNNSTNYIFSGTIGGDDDDDDDNDDDNYDKHPENVNGLNSHYCSDFADISSLLENSNGPSKNATSSGFPLLMPTLGYIPALPKHEVALPANSPTPRAAVVIVKKFLPCASTFVKNSPVVEGTPLDKPTHVGGQFIYGTSLPDRSWHNKRKRRVLDKNDPRYREERRQNNISVKKSRERRAEYIKEVETERSILKTKLTDTNTALDRADQKLVENEKKCIRLQNEMSSINIAYQAKLIEAENRSVALEHGLFDAAKEIMHLKSLLNDHCIPF